MSIHEREPFGDDVPGPDQRFVVTEEVPATEIRADLDAPVVLALELHEAVHNQIRGIRAVTADPTPNRFPGPEVRVPAISRSPRG